MTTLCIFNDGHPRARPLAESLVEAARKAGWKFVETGQAHTQPRADMIAGYGWRNHPVYEAYRAAGCAYFYIDLGYWRRKMFRSDYGGLHKIVLNGRHATEYFRRRRPADRLEFAPPLQEWKTGGRHILVTGVSEKSAMLSGLEYRAWETGMISRLRTITDRPIMYRPKPSDPKAQPIDGTEFSPPIVPIEAALDNAFALVTLHSNAALDAICAGIPIFCEEGLASVVSTPRLEDIETPLRDVDREQWLADVSYCHFYRRELSAGAVFELFKQDGLI